MANNVPQSLSELTTYMIDFIIYANLPSSSQIEAASEEFETSDEVEASALAMAEIIKEELARLRKIYERSGQ